MHENEKQDNKSAYYQRKHKLPMINLVHFYMLQNSLVKFSKYVNIGQRLKVQWNIKDFVK